MAARTRVPRRSQSLTFAERFYTQIKRDAARRRADELKRADQPLAPPDGFPQSDSATTPTSSSVNRTTRSSLTRFYRPRMQPPAIALFRSTVGASFKNSLLIGVAMATALGCSGSSRSASLY
jgi:hypothetical protein